MRCQNCKCRHGIDRQRLGYRRRKRLSEEGDAPFCFASWGEELALESLVTLGDEEGGSAEAAAATNSSIDLMIEQFLYVVDREQVLTIHGDNDGIPNLRDEHLIVCNVH